MNNKRVGIYTLGCRVNQYESCAIAERLKENGCVISKNDDADFYIVNTCAVTAESERKSRQLARRCASKAPTLVIGCASQINDAFKDIENVIYMGGNRNKSEVVDVILGYKNKGDSVIPMDGSEEYEPMYIQGKDELFSECRAFIKIQDGCNGKCTYCIIPKCRGKVRSRELSDIVEEAKNLVGNGYHEVILTGIEVSAYNKAPLYELIKQVGKIEGVERLRLGSLSPNIINEKFLSVVSSCEAFMPHVHLSLQSCSDKVLKGMMRPYRKNDIYERVALIRRYLPECMISADIIVGFPGESDDDFVETLNALQELNIFHVHSFPYSERKGTPAASMPESVPKNIRVERNNRLIKECMCRKKISLDSLKGKDVTVLVEKIVDGVAFGHTESFYEACFGVNGGNIHIGDMVAVKVVANDGEILKSIIKER